MATKNDENFLNFMNWPQQYIQLQQRSFALSHLHLNVLAEMRACSLTLGRKKKTLSRTVCNILGLVKPSLPLTLTVAHSCNFICIILFFVKAQIEAKHAGRSVSWSPLDLK